MIFFFGYSHPNGMRATINRGSDGKAWFLVEDAVIWLPSEVASQQTIVEIDGCRYVRIGGGEHAGKYIPIGSLSDVFAEKEQ
jgi:hypothetical protein